MAAARRGERDAATASVTRPHHKSRNRPSRCYFASIRSDAYMQVSRRLERPIDRCIREASGLREVRCTVPALGYRKRVSKERERERGPRVPSQRETFKTNKKGGELLFQREEKHRQ